MAFTTCGRADDPSLFVNNRKYFLQIIHTAKVRTIFDGLLFVSIPTDNLVAYAGGVEG